MASITIRNLDEGLKARLRVRAALGQRSMEEEVRQILRSTLVADAHLPQHLGESIRRRFQALGGVNLAIAPREPVRKPPKVSE